MSGEIPPKFALALLESLPSEGAFFSHVQGGDNWRLHYGIDPAYYALAGIVDAINTNTSATGNFKKPPKFDRWPTPAAIEEEKKKKPVTVADLFAKMGGANRK